jgi:hypothetical protein
MSMYAVMREAMKQCAWWGMIAEKKQYKRFAEISDELDPEKNCEVDQNEEIYDKHASENDIKVLR